MSRETTRPNLTSGRIHVYMGAGEPQAPAWLGLTTRALGAGLPVTVVLPPDDSRCQARKALAALSRAMASARLSVLAANSDTSAMVVGLFEAPASTSASLLVMPQILDSPLLDDLRASLQAHHDASPRPPLEVVISGRLAPDWLLAIADLISELRSGS